MATDRLFELAFLYRKTKLWKQLYDTELFAFCDTDDRLCFCCVMGQNGQHIALAVYPGQEGIDSFRQILDAPEEMTPAFRHELFFSQRCLQCCFENRDGLSPGQEQEARSYARRMGLTLRGKNAFPAFLSNRPGSIPWPELSEGEDGLLCQALEYALMLSKALERTGKEALGFRFCIPCQGEIPLLSRDSDGNPVFGRVALPEPVPPVFPEPAPTDELSLKRLSRLQRKGEWQCEVILAPQPMEPEGDAAPAFPALLLCWDTMREMTVSTQPVPLGDGQPEQLLSEFCALMLRENRRPASILVRDRRTFALLRRLSERLGISLAMEDTLDELDEVEEYLFSALQEGSDLDNDLSILVELLSDLDPDGLREMPAELREQLTALDEAGLLPEELSRKLAAAFSSHSSGTVTPMPKRSKRGRRRKYAERSYVISVSLGTGCYRHIRISAGDTFADLSAAILDAFRFSDDHMHMFCLDNRTWDSREVYISEKDEYGEDARLSRRYRLGEVGLHEGQRFKYLFDFGDEWLFQCRVLRELEEETEQPAVVRSKGKAPRQYEPLE